MGNMESSVALFWFFGSLTMRWQEFLVHSYSDLTGASGRRGMPPGDVDSRSDCHVFWKLSEIS